MEKIEHFGFLVGQCMKETRGKGNPAKINEYILRPGQEFSYNKVVGKRTIDAGYRAAPIYSGGKVVDDIGGGICQVSSTLYNAALLSNLEITSRSNHSFITSYAEPRKRCNSILWCNRF